MPPALSLSSLEFEAINRFVPYEQPKALDYASSLRREGLEPSSVSTVLNQAKYRTSARAKFGERALSMLFTEAGFEQSTRAAVAALHAQRIKDAGFSSVADLGCGIGADSLAFSNAGLSVVAVELDEQTAAITAFNLKEFDSSRVLVGNVEHLSLEDLADKQGKLVQALWLDPARRTVEGGHTSSRIFDAEAFSPPLSFVLKLAQTGIPLGVKMGPGIPHDAIPENCEAQWVSHGGQVVEVVLWFNALARPGVRRAATLLSADPLEPHILYEITSPVGDSGSEELEPAEVGDYLLEPDGAIVRAHLIGELAQELDAHLIDGHIAYLTTDSRVISPAVSTFEVLGSMPLNERVLKRWVREEEIGTLNIKKRGVDIVPEQLRKKLLGQGKKRKGSASATLIITRLGEGAESRRIVFHTHPVI